MTLYQALCYFVIYAFLGWVVEVAFHALRLGKIINRGFLNGPVCPIYGFGMLAICALMNVLAPGQEEAVGLPTLFLAGIVFTTSIELLGGWLLNTFFHARWWDYSKELFQFHGYICLRFSILWGLGTVFMIRIVHPLVRGYVRLFPPALGQWLLAFAYLTLLVDFVASVLTAHKLSRDLGELGKLRDRIRAVSDGLSQRIGEDSIRAKAELERQRSAAEARFALLEKRAERTRFFGTGRMLNAFPELKPNWHAELLQELREHLGGKKH